MGFTPIMNNKCSINKKVGPWWFFPFTMCRRIQSRKNSFYWEKDTEGEYLVPSYLTHRKEICNLIPPYIFRKTESKNFKKVCMIKLLCIISLSYSISNTHLVWLGSVTKYTGTQMVELKHNLILPPFCVYDASTLTFKRLLPYTADSNSYLSSLSIHEGMSPQPVH